MECRTIQRGERVKHGTYSNYTMGKCRCAACRKANTDHARAYRRSRPDYFRAYGRARARAWARLADQHPEEFAAIFEDEKQREGAVT